MHDPGRYLSGTPPVAAGAHLNWCTCVGIAEAVSGAPSLPSGVSVIDFASDKTYNNVTAVTGYDAKGQDVAVTFYFQKSTPDDDGNTTWNIFLRSGHSCFNGCQLY